MDGFITLGIGVVVVFFGLLGLIVVIKLMSYAVRLFSGDTPKRRAVANGSQAHSAAPTFSIPVNQYHNRLSVDDRGRLVAAISASLAQYMGESVSGIRIKSIRRLSNGADASARSMTADDRRQLVAAISCAVAENMGQDVSGIRIKSIRRVA